MHITQARKTDLQADVPVDSQRYMVGKQFHRQGNHKRLLVAKINGHYESKKNMTYLLMFQWTIRDTCRGNKYE